MKINVVLAGPLSKYGNGSRHQTMDIQDSWRLKDLIADLGIPGDKYSFAIINGEKSSEDVALQEGDEVKIFPMVSGG